ncbi:hypothetical protein ACQP1G_23915 [Nocardia sp. CA-107356]|uniref:hypothetical protein n=1 Tax=Nocardia sp. CA-107356 TaxID=3239972 RepID=UPI003D94270C
MVRGSELRAEYSARRGLQLIAHHGEEQAPASARLAALVESKLRAAGISVTWLPFRRILAVARKTS